MSESVYKPQSCIVDISELIPLINERLKSGSSVRFTPKGHSMLPLLREGKDTVTLSPAKHPLKKYDIALFQRDDGSYVLHRIINIGETYTCIGDNQFTAEHKIKPQQIIAVVSAFSRNKKQHSVCELGYRAYCRIWHYSRFFRRCLKAAYIRIKNTEFKITKNLAHYIHCNICRISDSGSPLKILAMFLLGIITIMLFTLMFTTAPPVILYALIYWITTLF